MENDQTPPMMETPTMETPTMETPTMEIDKAPTQTTPIFLPYSSIEDLNAFGPGQTVANVNGIVIAADGNKTGLLYYKVWLKIKEGKTLEVIGFAANATRLLQYNLMIGSVVSITSVMSSSYSKESFRKTDCTFQFRFLKDSRVIVHGTDESAAISEDYSKYSDKKFEDLNSVAPGNRIRIIDAYVRIAPPSSEDLVVRFSVMGKDGGSLNVVVNNCEAPLVLQPGQPVYICGLYKETSIQLNSGKAVLSREGEKLDEIFCLCAPLRLNKRKSIMPVDSPNKVAKMSPSSSKEKED